MTVVPPDDAPLGVEVVEDALLVPSASRSVYRGIDGAVFDRKGAPVARSLLTRNWGEISHPPDISGLDPSQIDRVEEPHVYGGYFFDHFGHFLLESLARLWITGDVGPLPVAWAAGDPPKRWQAEILSLLGIGGPMVFPRRPTIYRRLLVPDPGFRVQGAFHPRHAEFLSCFDTRREQGGNGERVWLSRGRVAPTMRSRGEAALQAELERRGWRVVHPQEHSVSGQLALLGQSSAVAGLEGSAFHAAVLLKGASAPLITLRRTVNRNYTGIAQRKEMTDLNLYGGYRIHDRKDVSLAAPRRWAGRVDELAGRLAGCSDDPECLSAIKREAEAADSFDAWDARQRRRVLLHARASIRRGRLGKRLRTRIGRRLGLAQG